MRIFVVAAQFFLTVQNLSLQIGFDPIEAD